jgi:hypothetical protein
MTDHIFLKDAHENSIQFLSQNSWFLCNRPDEPLKVSGCPVCLEASALKTSGRHSNTIWTLGQASPISTRSWISVDTIWEGSTRRPNNVATRPDAI